MATLHGLPPIARTDATILVLGTMPGKASLEAGQYYAHGRNLFWNVVGATLGFEASAPYAERVSRLIASKIAVWDVLRSCTRASSLDSDIGDPVPNNFAEFLRNHPYVDLVCFNGAKAEKLYWKHVKASITTPLVYRRLPSTSPANASMRISDKLSEWSVALRRE